MTRTKTRPTNSMPPEFRSGDRCGICFIRGTLHTRIDPVDVARLSQSGPIGLNQVY